ncbi:MAG: Asp-tRNA(Asn)/Glu-tRNA(Gln) amidotransferase subunit GatA, partial [Anaerolineales bacterium]
MSLTDLTLHEAAQALRAGDTSSVALTEAYLARVDALNPALNAFLTVTADSARQSAQSADDGFAKWR